MVKPTRIHQEEEEDDDEDIIARNDPSSQKGTPCFFLFSSCPVVFVDFFFLCFFLVQFVTGDLAMRAGGRSADQKVSAHRSKHSATEQRRRSKINERQA